MFLGYFSYFRGMRVLGGTQMTSCMGSLGCLDYREDRQKRGKWVLVSWDYKLQGLGRKTHVCTVSVDNDE